MTEKQVELARHALGLDGTRKKSYRNRFVAGDEHDDYGDWMEMVASGDAQKRDGSTIPFGGCHLFWLTRQGAVKALKRGEKLDREDFPNEERHAN